jgi:hypothetical protein
LLSVVRAPIRAAAQLISGIGFIDDGQIYMHKDIVRALTAAQNCAFSGPFAARFAARPRENVLATLLDVQSDARVR